MDDDLKHNFDYLAFGTKGADHLFERRTIIGPWRVYVVSRDTPGLFYRVRRADQNHVDHFKLCPGMDEYGKIRKWVGERNILNIRDAKCHVDWEGVVALLDGVPPRESMH